MATVLWCYLRNSAFSAKDGGPDYHLAADSPFRGAGTLGSDVGADIDQIQAAVG